MKVLCALFALLVIIVTGLVDESDAQCTGTPCAGSNVCSNGGTCRVTGQLCSDYVCRCPSSHCGITCQTSYTGCNTNNCTDGQSCTKKPSTNCTQTCCTPRANRTRSSFFSRHDVGPDHVSCRNREGPEDAEDEECFHGDNFVKTSDGKMPIRNLKEGDRVQVIKEDGSLAFQEVHFFSHKTDDRRMRRYVDLKTASGASILLTPSHYLPVRPESAFLPARLIKPGHMLGVLDEAGNALKWDEVISSSVKFSSGLYNPHTASGSIIVNDIAASVYTESLAPSIAHLTLWPVRSFYRYLSMIAAVDVNEGIPTWLLIGRDMITSA